MASGFANLAGRKVLQKHLKDYTPADPLYETYVDNKGRERTRRRDMPQGLSKRDAKILKSVRRRAHYLDKGFQLCGMRFGWTFIIGLIPGAGDIADASLNYLLVVRKARQAEIPDWLIHKMLFNNAISAGVGFVPIVGDIILAAFKANSRNAALLEDFLRIRGEEFLKGEGDRQQDPKVVRPGAGLQAGEHVPAEPGASAFASTHALNTIPNGAASANGSAKPKPPRRNSSGWRSMFGSRKGKAGTPPVTAPATDSRFVEHVSTANAKTPAR